MAHHGASRAFLHLINIYVDAIGAYLLHSVIDLCVFRMGFKANLKCNSFDDSYLSKSGVKCGGRNSRNSFCDGRRASANEIENTKHN